MEENSLQQQKQNIYKVLVRGCYTKRAGFPGGASGKEPVCQCRRSNTREFDPLVRKILWRRKRQLTPVFLPWTEEPGRSWGLQELDMTK